MRITNLKKQEHPYPFQNLIRFTTWVQNPEHLVLEMFGTKKRQFSCLLLIQNVDKPGLQKVKAWSANCCMTAGRSFTLSQASVNVSSAWIVHKL